MPLVLNPQKVTVIETHGTDKVIIDTDWPTAFPELKYPTQLQVEARKGYGTEWAKAMFPTVRIEYIATNGVSVLHGKK